MRKLVVVLATLAVLVQAGSAQEAHPGNGLETGGDLRVRVVVDELYGDAVRISLNREALELRCAQELAANGLTVSEDASLPELRVTVRVEGFRYSSTVELRRNQSADAVWSRTSEGVVQQLSYVAPKFFNWKGRSHEPGARVGHSAYIVDAMLGLVDAFSADFLAANGK